MRRFFIPAAQIHDNLATIEGSDVHHLAHVLRKKAGDVLEATDGSGNLMSVKIISISESNVRLEILEVKRQEERRIRLRLFQAVPRGDLFGEILAKACELGVNEVIPVITERTIPRYSEERGLKKMGRWERIVLESMKQTGRSQALTLHPALPVREIPAPAGEKSLRILPWELEEELTLKQLIGDYAGITDIDLMVGPEGGLSLREADFLRSIGFQTVTLGKRILKVETAAIVTIGNIYFSLE